MKTKRKIILISIVSLLAFTFFVGCTKSEEENIQEKAISFTMQDKEMSLLMSVPEVVSEYTTLSYEEITYGEGDSYIRVALTLENNNETASIANFSIYTIEQYEATKLEGGPVDKELIRDEENNVVVGFSGLQSNPFVEGSEQAELTDKYQEKVDEMLETVNLSVKK